MAIGIGVDIITISRMRDVLETGGKVFMDKVFTPWEHKSAETDPDRVAYLAMTFAAKEAIFKTFGIGWETGVQFKEIDPGKVSMESRSLISRADLLSLHLNVGYHVCF